MNGTDTSLFDPNTFLEQTVSGAMDTKYPLIPAGEYAAISKSIGARKQPNLKEPNKPPYTVLDITWAIDDASVKEATQLSTPTCRQSVFLDLDANGQLDTAKTKNVQLGRLREALGLNQAERVFSFGDLVGKPAMVKIEHSPNPKDPENPYSNVTKVAEV